MVPEELYNKYEEVFFYLIYSDRTYYKDFELFGLKKTRFIVMMRDLFGPKPNVKNLVDFINHPAIQYLWCNKSY